MALVVIVGVVLAGKDNNSDNEAVYSSESDVNGPVDSSLTEQAQEIGEQNREASASEITEAEDPKYEVVAKANANEKLPDEKSRKDTANRTIVEEKAESKPAAKKEQPGTSAKVLPKMIELGAEQCVPCKMMKPVIEELQKEYKGKLEVMFIDVWKDNSAAQEYGIQSIPTQIFLDENGQEFFRHVGFFPKESILKTFEDHGIKLN